MTTKIVTVVGARPQFVKASAVSAQMMKTGAVSEVIVHTGQHYDDRMSEVFFRELGLAKPAYNLGIGGGTHGEMTGRQLEHVERVLIQEKPACVLVYGDTNSTLAGALAASKLGLPVAHVEAGLRSFNRQMPEEINRVLTDHLSELLFAPTELAVANLRNEGIFGEKVQLVGDVMFDVALHYGERAARLGGILDDLKTKSSIRPGNYCLVTVHRAENTDHPKRLMTILETLVALSADMPVVWPVHPRTQAALSRLGNSMSGRSNVTLLGPLSYLDMVQLEKHAALIATDSGGVQKEAFFYRVPCVTLRDETEWVELVEAGWNRIASPDQGVAALLDCLRNSVGRTGKDVHPYGRGDAALRIYQILRKIL